MSWAASIDVDLRHAARELAEAEEHVERQHWRFATSSLYAATEPLRHLYYTLWPHLTRGQRKDVNAMVTRAETLRRQVLRGVDADEYEQQTRRA